jgi:hypothetical protein
LFTRITFSVDQSPKKSTCQEEISYTKLAPV